MPTLVDVEGFEHQVTTSNATTTMNPKLWDTSAGAGTTLSFVTGRNGIGTALHVDENATNAGRLLRNLTTAGTMVVASFYVRLIDIPVTVTSRVFHVTADTTGQIQVNTSGQIMAAWATGTSNSPATGPAINDGLWHLVDVRFNSSPATHTIEWTVDGNAQSNATSGLAAASNIVSWAAGTSLTSGAATFEIDDIVISTTSGDYAIGAHTVYAKLPAADLNYTNVGTNIMERASDGADISASVPAWSMLNTWPPTTVANGIVVTSSASGSGNYAEVTFAARPAWATSTAWAVTAVVAHMSDTTGANSGASKIVAGATTTAIFGPADMSETSKHYTPRLITAPAGGWTTTNLDAATGQVGFGTLQPGAPEWHALMLQIATPDLPSVTTPQAVAAATTVDVGRALNTGKPQPIALAMGLTFVKSIPKIVPATVAGTIALATSKVAPKAIAAATTLTAALTRNTLKPVAATVAATMALVRTILKPVATTSTLTPAILRSITSSVAAGVTMTAALMRRMVKTIAAATTATVVLATQKAVSQAIAATATLTVALSRRISETVAAIVTFMADVFQGVSTGVQLFVRTNKSVAATTTITATVARYIVGKLIAAATTVVADVDAVFQAGTHAVDQAIDAATTLSVGLTRNVGKLVTAAATVTAAVTRSITHTIAATAVLAVSSVRSLPKSIAASSLQAVALVRSTAKTIAASSPVTAALGAIKVSLKSIAATTTLGVGMVKNTGKLVVAAATMTAAAARKTAHTVAAGITATVAIVRRTSHLVAATTTLTVGLLRAAAHKITVAAGTAITAVLDAVMGRAPITYDQAVDAATSLAAALVRRTTHTVAAAVALTAALPRSLVHAVSVAAATVFDVVVGHLVGKLLDVALTVAVGIQRFITKTIGVLLDMGALAKSTSSNLARGFAIKGPTDVEGTGANSADVTGAGSADVTGANPWGAETGEDR